MDSSVNQHRFSEKAILTLILRVKLPLKTKRKKFRKEINKKKKKGPID